MKALLTCIKDFNLDISNIRKELNNIYASNVKQCKIAYTKSLQVLYSPKLLEELVLNVMENTEQRSWFSIKYVVESSTYYKKEEIKHELISELVSHISTLNNLIALKGKMPFHSPELYKSSLLYASRSMLSMEISSAYSNYRKYSYYYPPILSITNYQTALEHVLYQIENP